MSPTGLERRETEILKRRGYKWEGVRATARDRDTWIALSKPSISTGIKSLNK
jgi:hypothetical protein